jgi:NAD(P)-dependent dehydrogenase (short-subunit alcohol dehydrogenase family)
MIEMRELAGRTAFVTGGGGGFGLALATALLEEGMHVVIADKDAHRIESAAHGLGGYGARIRGITCDVADRDSVRQAAAMAIEAFGKVHVLCNNAGVLAPGPLESGNTQDWLWSLSVNVVGVVHGIEAFVPHMRAHGEGGHIVNTASMAAFISGPSAGIYTTAKFAVRGLSEALRWSLLPHGIGVSVYCPGLLDTNIYRSEETRPAHLSTDTTPPNPEIMSRLPEVQRQGMAPREAGEKVLRAIRRNDFYIFSHPEFREELEEIFAEALAALPDEPVPPARLEFEDGRRAMKAAARSAWPEL